MYLGVLLLNAVLTVKCRTPNSHKDQGWEKLTDAVIKHLNTNGKGIVFLLWGSYAQKKAEFLDQVLKQNVGLWFRFFWFYEAL